MPQLAVRRDLPDRDVTNLQLWLRRTECNTLKTIIQGLLTKAEVDTLNLTLASVEQPVDAEKRDEKRDEALRYIKMLELLDSLETGDMEYVAYSIEPVVTLKETET